MHKFKKSFGLFKQVLPLISLLLLFSCEKNYPPKIVKTEFVRQPGIGNTSFNLRVEASDPDLDQLTYLWESVLGEFTQSPDQSETVWEAPSSTTDREYTVRVTVSDGKAEVTDSLDILVQAITYGRISGFALYTGTRVPVPEALVSIDRKEAITDINGAFLIEGVRTGRQTLTAEKADFTMGSTEVLIKTGLVTANVNLTSEKYTGKLYGQITGNRTGEPKPFYKVIVLNPDDSESELTFISSGSGYYEVSWIPLGFRRIIVKDDVRIRMETLIYLDSPERQFNIQIPEPFLFKDTRDNREYQAVRIFGQIWMAENLAFIPRVSPPYDQGGIWVYGYSGTDVEAAKSTSNYAAYGCLYDWETAMSDDYGNGRDICPPGWHLPDDQDWKNLEQALGMDPIELDSVGWRFTGSLGRKLKFESGWDSDGNGTNSSGFAAMPAGYRAATGVFLGIFGYTNFWVASEYDTETAWRRYLYYNQLAIGRFNDFKTSGFSVRCMKNN